MQVRTPPGRVVPRTEPPGAEQGLAEAPGTTRAAQGWEAGHPRRELARVRDQAPALDQAWELEKAQPWERARERAREQAPGEPLRRLPDRLLREGAAE